MKLAVLVAVLVAIVGLAGCVSNTKKLNRVALGMTKQEVVQSLGNPDSIRASKGIEYMVYGLRTVDAGECVGWSIVSLGILAPAACSGFKDDYFVQLKQGKVTAYGKVGDFDSIQDPESTININQTIKTVE